MALFLILGLLPAVLGCANPGSNSCASYIKSSAAVASPFCATFTQSVVTATTGLPSWATNCSNKPSQLSKECSCYYTGGGGSQPTATVTVPGDGGGGGATPTGITTTLPKSSGSVASAAPITVSGSFDGGMKLYDRSSKSTKHPSGVSTERISDISQPLFVRSRQRPEKTMLFSSSRPVPRCLTL